MPGTVCTWSGWLEVGALAAQPWDGLLFDLDGTLVDTLRLHHEAYRRVFADHGLQLGWEGFRAHCPSPAAVSIPNFVRAAGGDPNELPDTRTLHLAKKQAFATIMDEMEAPRLPAAELFESVLGSGKVGIVTSGNRHGVTVILKQQGWLEALNVLVTGDDVEQGKPHPEPYLAGARALSCATERCIAFEDTATGRASALAAGMCVVDVESQQELR